MKKLFFLITVVTCLLINNSCLAQIYIAFDGVDGESQFKAFPNSTEISSVSGGAENKTSIGSASAGASTGKSSLGEFIFTKSRGLSSSQLQMGLFSGKRFLKAEIRFYTPATQQCYLTIILEDVFITDWKVSDSAPEKPSENFTIVAARIKTEEIFKNPDGSTKRIATGWDVVKNISITW